MYALIRLGHGKYYGSYVFGYYENIVSTDEYQRYVESIYSPYYVVLNEEKTRLVRVFEMAQNKPQLIRQVLIVDLEQQWTFDEDGTGGVSFLPRHLADSVIEMGETPPDILEACLALDREYHYEPYQMIRNDADISNLMGVFGGFHDACIDCERLQEDGRLYLKFKGEWGCDLEVWFWDDLQYCTKAVDPELYDPYWFDSTLIIENGYVYLMSDSDRRAEDVNDGLCWFRAKNMMYRVIPK
ncbi:MAG: hypothetical protein II767_10440 [Proteobacteria bacterium]|nr:hypothetical protein [Pseudomonadota bacterium]MBQ4360664.1 hypothetical protein [Pseudomonadota bacterium]